MNYDRDLLDIIVFDHHFLLEARFKHFLGISRLSKSIYIQTTSIYAIE